MNNNDPAHMPTHQHQSTTQKQAKEGWNTLVKMTELQTEFRKSFTEWTNDKGNSQHIVELGEELMKLQKSTGKSGGSLSMFQVMHRVEEAKAAISKGLHTPPVEKVSHTTKNIVKRANGDTVWVLK